jgi:hypothetical protein
LIFEKINDIHSFKWIEYIDAIQIHKTANYIAYKYDHIEVSGISMPPDL